VFYCGKAFNPSWLRGKVPRSARTAGFERWVALAGFVACFNYRLSRGVTMPTLLVITYLTNQPVEHIVTSNVGTKPNGIFGLK
jgi:hypothetical protein